MKYFNPQYTPQWLIVWPANTTSRGAPKSRRAVSLTIICALLGVFCHAGAESHVGHSSTTRSEHNTQCADDRSSMGQDYTTGVFQLASSKCVDQNDKTTTRGVSYMGRALVGTEDTASVGDNICIADCQPVGPRSDYSYNCTWVAGDKWSLECGVWIPTRRASTGS